MTAEVLRALAQSATGNPSCGELLEALPVAIYVTDAEGRLTYFNSAAAKLSGRQPELGVDKWCVTWKIFLENGTPLPHDQCPMAVALRGQKVSEGVECIAERPDGTRFWFTPYPAVLRDESGRIVGGLNLLIDITDRKLAQIKAERAAQLLSSIVESSDDAIISKSLEGIVTSWNKSAERLFGYAEDEMVGKSISILIPPDRLEEESQILARLSRGERVDHIDTIRRKKDGTVIEISLTISPVKNASGEIIGASKIARDTTPAKLAERESRLLSSIVSSSDDAIISKNLNGIITSWNQSAERLFGYTADEIIGQSVTVLIPPDRLDEEPRIIARLKRGERVDHFETLRRRKDGTLLEISLTISPIRDRNGDIVGASKIARDVTERKRVEAEMRRVNRDLEQFAFSASHDLQEPLRSVKIFSELLVQRYSSKLDGQALEFLQFLRAGATRMETLVSDLLAYTRVGAIDRNSGATDANEVLAATRESLLDPISQTAARITSGKLPSVRIHRTHLQQLFQNLVGNALKYRSKERAPVIHVSAKHQLGQWTFSVEDNGIGIDSQYKENIFGLFKRLHTNEEYSGTGIGLAICQRIVAQYGGRIWVESQPEQGSVFRFTIPN